MFTLGVDICIVHCVFKDKYHIYSPFEATSYCIFFFTGGESSHQSINEDF